MKKSDFPTRVGMARVTQSRMSAPGRFPHTRGDGPPAMAGGAYPTKISPHAWGWPEPMAQLETTGGDFPTRVGMARGTR